MSAKKGTCIGNHMATRRAVGVFGGRLLCGPCRPRSEAWKKRRALRIEKAEQEDAKKAAEEKTRLEEAKEAEELSPAEREAEGIQTPEDLAKEEVY